MSTYLSAMMDIEITISEIHKALYLMKVAGQDFDFSFTKTHQGPSIENIEIRIGGIDMEDAGTVVSIGAI
jgi:hypothetical protein